MDTATALSLILAALAVLLTALAIFIGIAAVWGFAGIKEDAKKIASKVATEAADKRLAEYFEQEALKDRIKGIVAGEGDRHADHDSGS